MIQKEQAKAFLKAKKQAKIKASDLDRFSEKYRVLGLMITRSEYKKNYYARSIDIQSYTKHFGDDPTINPWQNKEGKQLATLLFGQVLAQYIPDVWDRILTGPYQQGYYRRSFRAQPNTTYTALQLTYLQKLYKTGAKGYNQLTLKELAQYDVYTSYESDFSFIFAAALEQEAPSDELFTLIKDIVQGEDEIGGVTRSLIKGLLLTNNSPRNWKLVEDLLLAAQRQEGLRQTILECLDETSIGALRHLIHVILDHNLARFSSVIRTVDTWFGFGWNAPKSNTIKKILHVALSCFDDASLAESTLQSNDNLEVYIALWFLGLKDVDEANLQAIHLIETAPKAKKILACRFIHQTQRTNDKVWEYINQNFGQDIELDYWLLHIVPEKPVLNQELFKKIKQYGDVLVSNPKTIEGQIFSWTYYEITSGYFYHFLVNRASQEQDQQLAENITTIPSEPRWSFIRKIFPDHSSWYARGYYSPQGWITKEKKLKKIDLQTEPWKKNLAHQAIADKNESVMAAGIRLFESMDLEQDDMVLVETLLSRKNKTLRERLILLVLKQQEPVIQNTTTHLVNSSKINQRLAGLELLTELQEENRLIPYITETVNTYYNRPKLSKNESTFLDKFTPRKVEYTFENGFGVIDYKQLQPLIKPKLLFTEEKKSATNFLLGHTVDATKIKSAIDQLVDAVTEHKDYEYKAVISGEYGETYLLGNEIRFTHCKAYDLDPEERLEYLPLPNIWKTWYKNAELNDFELMFLLQYLNGYPLQFTFHKIFDPFFDQYVPRLKGTKLSSTHRIGSLRYIVECLYDAYVDHQMMHTFKIDLLEDMIARLPDELHSKDLYKKPNADKKFSGLDNLMGWKPFDTLAKELENHPPELSLLKRYWDLSMYCFAHQLVTYDRVTSIDEVVTIDPKNISINSYGWQPIPPPAWITVCLYNAGCINHDDLQYQCLINLELLSGLEGEFNYRNQNLKKQNIPIGATDALKKNILAVELERGDLPTSATTYTSKFSKVEGIHYLFHLLDRLGKETFTRGYSWGANKSLKESFSRLLQKTIPATTDDLAQFVSKAKEAKLTKKRGIEVALYAPQWAYYIQEYLGIDKLESAVWWFHAHTSSYLNAEKETLISRYSAVPQSDFARGALDIDWFHNIYTKVGKQHWKLLHDAAKYISETNEHRLVKLYSGVLLGDIKIKETLAKIKQKRDKDYVRALGLIPFSKTNPKKDVLNRYHILHDFLNQSKQFGAQRQASEKNAAQIGLDNLARNAGYNDRVRFSWAMESEALQQIMKHAKVAIDNLEIALVVDEQGKAAITVIKDGKTQKSIPAKYKKHKDVLKLQNNKAYLKKQYQRTRASLENAMMHEQEFTAVELKNIFLHPVVSAMLSKLVLTHTTNQASGFWKQGELEDCHGEVVPVHDNDTFVVAHPSHLYQNVTWDLYQKYAFDQQLVQPFKQIFRELYLITQNELEAGIKSERYQGHQIQPQKTVALLKTRGWTVSHEEGLQKVYHKKGYRVTLFAMADWFSPADIEAPTLEDIRFYSLNDAKPILLKDIDPVIFSEVMRDIDLVVSVAHVGGVDPEASHSTLQMRAVLAKESARLFKADNITVKERHILIKGQLGDYSIHLGSGMVSKNGLQLSLIPVHSQHRGRLFLPFIDDDPKSAEIISKMKLLAEDRTIKDPTILAQINVT